MLWGPRVRPGAARGQAVSPGGRACVCTSASVVSGKLRGNCGPSLPLVCVPTVLYMLFPEIGWCPLTMGGKGFIGSPRVGQHGW